MKYRSCSPNLGLECRKSPTRGVPLFAPTPMIAGSNPNNKQLVYIALSSSISLSFSRSIVITQQQSLSLSLSPSLPLSLSLICFFLFEMREFELACVGWFFRFDLGLNMIPNFRKIEVLPDKIKF